MTITMQDITEAVAEAYNVPAADILGPYKPRRISQPRQAAYALCRSISGKSWPEIGRFFGGRDHTSAIYGVRAHETRLMRDQEYSQAFDDAVRAIKPPIFIRTPIFKSRRGNEHEKAA